MEKIIKLNQIDDSVKQIKNQCQTIVLVGGCFDILHYGHLKFLEKAKKDGDILIVALESDEKIKKLKGEDRPIHSQKQRAEMLTALRVVDFVICLPLMKSDQDYLELVKKVKPDVIAVTAGDPKLKNKKEQAKAISAKVKIVTPRLKTLSTQEIISRLKISSDRRCF